MIPLEDARAFLAKVIPWPQPGDPPAFMNIHNTFMPDNGLRPGQKLPWAGRAVRTLDEAMNAINYALTRPSTLDIYYCTSTQREAIERTGKNNFKYFKPIRNQANTVALKTLFVDVDVKGGPNGYANQNEAVREFARFLKETGLPKPSVIVFSGGGLHVYFTLAKPLPVAEWRGLAFALAEAGRRHGLKFDAGCTTDSARVLRVPNTKNFKTDPPRPVGLAYPPLEGDYSVEYIAAILEPYKTNVPALPQAIILPASFQAPSPSVVAKFKLDNDLSAGLNEEFPPIKIKPVAMECGFVREALMTGGLAYDQPKWNLTTLIATFTENGRKNAHLMGDKHPDYSKESTDEMFDRKTKEKDALGLGWPSCATIERAGCKACQDCKHFALGKTPLHTAVRSRPQPAGSVTSQVTPFGTAAQESDLPAGYDRDADGRIRRVLLQGDGSSKLELICDYSMEEPWLQTTPEMLHFTSKIERGRKKQVSIPLEIINTLEMRRHLQSQGFMLPVSAKTVSTVSEFLMSWIKLLRETCDSVRSAPFGWNVKDGELEGFVYGGRIWTPGTDRAAASPDAVIAQHYAPTGNVQPWKDTAKLITDQGRPELDALVASAFAAPLVRFTGQPGVLMSAYSMESGIGKSTALRVAQSAWGDPIKAVQSLSDTQNAVMNKLGEIRSLPLYWDELKTEDDTKKFVNITFQVTQGKEKARLTRNVQQREPGSWQTLLVSASNDSLLNYVVSSTNMTTAGLYRVFEYVVTPPQVNALGQIDSSEASLKIAKLNDNYGVVGLEYAKFLGANHQRVAQEVADHLKALGQEVNSGADERYWLALIATICVGAQYANDLKFTEFNLVALKGFMLKVLQKMRNERANQPVDMNDAMNVSNVLAQFLNEMRAKHTLWTNRIHIARGKPPSDSIKIMGEHNWLNLDGIYVHIGMEDKLLRISSTRLSEWLGDKSYSRHLFTKALEKQLGMKHIRGGRIGSGTRFAGANEYLLEIDLAGTPHANFIDEA